MLTQTGEDMGALETLKSFVVLDQALDFSRSRLVTSKEASACGGGACIGGSSMQEGEAEEGEKTLEYGFAFHGGQVTGGSVALQKL